MMKSIMRALFYGMPKVGESYYFDNPESSPWDENTVIEVLDTSMGWVLYTHNRGITHMADRMRQFNFMYKKCGDSN